VIDLLDYLGIKNSTIVVDGVVLEVYENRAEVKHWKAYTVEMDVSFERTGTSDTVRVCCWCTSIKEDPELSCGNHWR